MKTRPTFLVAAACIAIGQVALAQISFERVTTGDFAADVHQSFGCSWADYDLDGWEDLLVPNAYDQPNRLYRNNRDGTLSRVASGPVPTDGGDSSAAVWADFDNDGDLDLFIANYDPPNDFFYLNHGGTFTRVLQGSWVNEGVASNGAAWGDYDGNGYVDLFVAVPHNLNDLLYRNSGAGTLEQIQLDPITTSGMTGIGCQWLDYDNDGDQDLYVVNSADGEANFLFRNDGDGGFSRILEGPHVTDVLESFGAAWGDYDNDGDLDLFVTEMPDPNSFYRNDGDGLFVRLDESAATMSAGNSREAVWADFDNDGYLDLFVVSASGQGNWLFRNTRDGQFEPIYDGVVVTDRAHSFGCATADFDRDGYLDLCVANGGLDHQEANFLYRNQGGVNPWLLVRLIGTASNQSAIGAKLRVKAKIWDEDVWQLREVSGSVKAFSQDSLLAHFGLGDATKIDTLRIEWPSGMVQEFKDVPANQILTVTEPPRLIPQGAGAFQIQCWINQSFEVQASLDLVEWSTVETVMNLTGTLVFEDAEAAQHESRYYRVVAK